MTMFQDSNFNQDISSWTFNDSDLDDLLKILLWIVKIMIYS